jgi:UDP-2,3-diacylglucosamine pyrophosphatase LpxH
MRPWDVVYAVSDLHLGGQAEFQIFTQAELFRDLCHDIAERAKAEGKRAALVVNGDVVDFLSEVSRDEEPPPEHRYFDAVNACERLARIASDPAFSPVFEGWKHLVREGASLVVVLGNHDIELRLPECQRWLRETLGGADPAAQERVILALDGTGYRCKVGASSAFFVHGNDWDPWNKVDHEALRKAAEAQAQGLVPLPVPPCDGTRLVIDVMNPIKWRYRFVDRLKPEGKALAALLAAVDSGNLKRIGGFLRSGAGTLWEKLNRPWLLGPGEAPRPAEPPPPEESLSDEEAVHRLLASVAADTPAQRRGAAVDLLLQTEIDYRTNRRSLDYVSNGAGDDMLGGGTPTLRTVLWLLLSNDETFDHLAPDPMYRVACRLAATWDFFVVGHTHLRRSLRLPSGTVYYNSGTWIDLLSVPPEALVSDSTTDALVAALTGNDLDGYTQRLPTVVKIESKDGGKAVGCLLGAPAGTSKARVSLGDLVELPGSRMSFERRP